MNRSNLRLLILTVAATCVVPAMAETNLAKSATGAPTVNVPIPKQRKGPTAAEKRQIKSDYKTAKAKCRQEVGTNRMSCYQIADQTRNAALAKVNAPAAGQAPAPTLPPSGTPNASPPTPSATP